MRLCEYGVEGPTPSISVKDSGLFGGGLRHVRRSLGEVGSLATAGGFAGASMGYASSYGPPHPCHPCNPWLVLIGEPQPSGEDDR